MANLGEVPLVKHSIRDDGVALIELNRPKKRNALSQVMINQIASTLHLLDQDSKVRVVVLTGCAPNGPFCGMVSMNED
jgi:enoyl-CoA hydratase